MRISFVHMKDSRCLSGETEYLQAPPVLIRKHGLRDPNKKQKHSILKYQCCNIVNVTQAQKYNHIEKGLYCGMDQSH